MYAEFFHCICVEYETINARTKTIVLLQWTEHKYEPRVRHLHTEHELDDRSADTVCESHGGTVTLLCPRDIRNWFMLVFEVTERNNTEKTVGYVEVHFICLLVLFYLLLLTILPSKCYVFCSKLLCLEICVGPLLTCSFTFVSLDFMCI